jgi:MinD superfamily P-loop ATPase
VERGVSEASGQNRRMNVMVKQITVLSGKGGTGKTTLVASFAALSKKIVLTDCDVDAPDLHLLLNPQIVQKQEFVSSKVAIIDKEKCIQCKKCEEHCRFNAIENSSVDSVLCEGCGVCAYLCPVQAVELKERISGYAFISKTKYGPMSHARLNPGEENSGKLVTLVRKNAKQVTETENRELILNDGPPGIGCPVIASLGGVDMGLIVVEPTLSGIHDMERALGLLNHFGIPSLVCINKYDINEENTDRIVEYCGSKGVEVVGKIPFDCIVTEAMVARKTVVEYSPDNRVSQEIEMTWERVLSALYSQ